MNIKLKPTYITYLSVRRRNLANKLEFAPRNSEELVSYCTDMANAIHTELQQHGHCWLIDNAFSTGFIFSVDWAMVHALLSQKDNGSQLQLELPALFQTLPVSDSMEAEMRPLYQAPSAAGNSRAQEAQRAALTQELSDLTRQAEQARQTKAELESRVSQLRAEAVQLEQENLEARTGIQQLLSSAGSEAEALLRAAREKAGRIHVEMLQGIAEERAQEAAPAQPGDASLREQVESETRRLETTIRTSLDSYRDEIHQMLYTFRTGLYKADYSALALAYQKLYLFASDAFGGRIDALCRELGDEALAEQTQSSLRKVQGQLLRRVSAIEESLKKLGLSVFRPEPGAEYNDVYHAAENAEDDGYLEATVSCCVCPGVCIGEQVLCRAAVLVDIAEQT